MNVGPSPLGMCEVILITRPKLSFVVKKSDEMFDLNEILLKPAKPHYPHIAPNP